MNELSLKFAEHQRIDNYLKRRSMQILQTKAVINHEDKISNFPVGLIIITKNEQKEDIIEFINHYACQLFQIKENSNIKLLKDKFNEYIRLKNNYSTKSDITLKDIIFNSTKFSFEIENFFPFQCKHSKNIILYIKINDVSNEKYIVIDKYDKYLEEQKYIEFNLIKNINYQYLHTLYHELNNPLNALLAISGENKKFNSTEIGNTRISRSPMLNKKKTVTKKFYKKENRLSGLSSLNNSKSKNIYNNQDEIRQKKRSLYDNISSDISNRINLLVKIIKIFIKNFIMYLKTRADNLLSLKNEFNMENEVSDIINAVEVSEYEKDLTKHKNVKLNLEYIFDLYMKKYHCLFKYKEIEYDTNFSELKNMYVVTDDFNFTYYIRQIFTYLYYVVPKKEGFYFIYDKKEKNKVKITIKKKINGNASKVTDPPNNFNMNQLIQTKEMTKEVLYSMSKKLNFLLEIYDNENNNNNKYNENNKVININVNNEQTNYLSITIPITKKDKLTEADEFKDEEINENVIKSNLLLEEKLKRQLPCIKYINDNKNSNISTIHIVDVISKNGDDKKENTDSFISLPKNLNFKNDNQLIQNNLSNNNLIKTFHINNCFQKNKFGSFKSTPSNDSFLSKCLKISDNKKFEKDKEKKEKSKFRKESGVNINLIKNKIDNHSSNKNIFINITNINNNPEIKYIKTKSYASLKRIMRKNNENIVKTQKTHQLKGIFSLINKYGSIEQMDNYSQISNNIKKLKKCEITFKSNSPKSILKNKNKKVGIGCNQKNCVKRESGAQNSVSINTSFLGNKNPTKSNYKSSFYISDIGAGKNDDEKNKIKANINNKNMIINNVTKNRVHIEYIKEDNKNKENSNISKNTKPSHLKSNKNLNLSGIEESEIKKRNSENINPLKSNKDCMTFFIEQKKSNLSNNNINANNNTIIDESFKVNKNLFLEADKERSFQRQKYLQKENHMSFNSQSEIEQNSEDYEDEECEENEECEEKEDSYIPSHQCDCADLLVVDDEEFNVMATRKMLKNLGFESDKAYNGEECINLIREKKENKCQCNKNHYKVIFLDIVMPVMDGIKTAKKIQEMIDNKEIDENINIIFVSGNIDGSDLKKSLLEINCVKECLQKPVQISKYEKILEKYYNYN